MNNVNDYNYLVTGVLNYRCSMSVDQCLMLIKIHFFDQWQAERVC